MSAYFKRNINISNGNDLCTLHRAELTILCKRCSEVICARCIYDPKHREHFAETELIDQIGEVFGDQSPASPAKAVEEDNVIKQRLDILWRLIRKQAAAYTMGQTAEDEISAEYRRFHESLMLEEHRLKKSVCQEKDANYQAVQTILQEIQTFKLLDDQNVKVTSSTLSTVTASATAPAGITDSSNGSATGIRDSYCSSVDGEGEEDNYYHPEDSLDSYAVESIIKFVNECSSLDKFYKEYKSTIFFNSNTNDQDQLQYNMLKTIQRHFRVFTSDYTNKLQDPARYTLKVERPLLNKLMAKVGECIFVDKQQNSDVDQQKVITSSALSTANAEECDGEHDYIFSVADDGHCSIFDLERNTIDILSNINVTKYTHQSIVSTGDNFVYIFDGHPNKFYRYDMLTKRVDISEPIQKIQWAYSITACYDGGKYIYLTGGQSTSTNISRVDRFDIQTKQFEKLGNTGTKNFHALSFYFEGSVYIVCNRDGKDHLLSLIAYDTTTNVVNVIIPDMGFHISTDCICFDGKELIYFVDYYNNFYCTNIKTKMKKQLDNPPNIKPYAMIYRNTTDQELDKVGYIYMLCGKSNSNHVYNVKNNEWDIVHISDPCKSRMTSGACLVRLKKPIEPIPEADKVKPVKGVPIVITPAQPIELAHGVVNQNPVEQDPHIIQPLEDGGDELDLFD